MCLVTIVPQLVGGMDDSGTRKHLRNPECGTGLTPVQKSSRLLGNITIMRGKGAERKYKVKKTKTDGHFPQLVIETDSSSVDGDFYGPS